ncbi:MAG: hypothetical protein KKE23_02280 [Nanoarchaeota archaeon]|nr:hypothetical protein [Nanoarchaeota archaeon]
MKDCKECEGLNEFKKYRNNFFKISNKFSEKKIYVVSISTPYLTDTLKTLEEAYTLFPEEMPKGMKPLEAAKIQQKKYGFDPKNLHGQDRVNTKKGNVVMLSTLEKTVLPCKVFADLDISGCNEPSEHNVQELKGSGLLVARYSIFYGGNSKYTGSSPQDSGYSLDIPKNPKTVKALLQNDSFLEAIMSRDGSMILRSLGKLNKKLEQPILVTPYLEEALEVEK